MWKSILAGTAAVAIAGTSMVYAEQPHRAGGMHWRPSQQDRAAFTDARIAALKAGLELTPDQAKLWPAFETALRDIAKAHTERREARQNEPRSSDPVERLRREADELAKAGVALKGLADAQAPLYTSLDDAQKRRFSILSHFLAPRHGRHMRVAERGGRAHDWRERGERGGMHGHGPQGPRGGTDQQRL
jgi:zinc resistance-associated protein